MAAGDLTPGLRVVTVEDLANPGDYTFGNNGDALWFLLPRIEEFPGEPENEYVVPHFDRFWRGTHRIHSGPDGWTITEDADGTVTVSPSIFTRTNYGEKRIETGWHGYLRAGIWEEV